MKRLFAVLLLFGFAGAAAVMVLSQPVSEVRGKTPAVPLSQTMTPEQELAQNLALSDPIVQGYTLGHRSEVFGVRDVLASQYTKAAAACATADCRQVEIYNWDEDVAVSVLVNLDTQEVLDVLRQPSIHPGINQRLHDLSLELAMNSPEVIEALGYQPSADQILAAVDGGMPNTACKTGHLCVVPTFPTQDDGVLAVVIDLTDETIVGLARNDADNSGSGTPSAPEGCPASGSVSRDGWTLDYATTGTDSLNVTNIYYNGTLIADSIKLAEWHVDYGGWGYEDTTGCGGGGGGFPIYPYGETQVLDLLDGGNNVIGFEVVQDFRMGNWGNTCNYRYEQRMRFYDDGRFRPVSAAYGKGCATDGTYRPLVRINLALDGDDNDNFYRWDGAAWSQMTTEDYLVPYVEAGHGPHEIDPDGYSWMVSDDSGFGFFIEQDVGQYDGIYGEGDDPFLYPVLHHPNEGDTDLGIIGDCCNGNGTHQQGPENYINGENIDSENIVLWYVPQAVTDASAPDYYCWTIAGEPNPETYPCYAGPMFVPITAMAPTAGFTSNSPVVLGNNTIFTNTTTGTNPITYTWNFGDGGNSSAENPTHMYASEGDYTVTLMAENENGSTVYTDTVMVGIAPTAVMTHPTEASTFEPVSFTNNSTGTGPFSYEWDFGDGSEVSTKANPVHTYTDSGNFTVSLTVNSPFGSSETTSQIAIDKTPVAPTAAFTHTAVVNVGDPVVFTNQTVGTPPVTYEWDLGDGSPVATSEHVTHTYAATGNYTVTLTATNDVGANVTTSTIEVTVMRNYFAYMPVVMSLPE